MRCSYCGQKGHSKRNCEVLSRDFRVFVHSSQRIRADYLALLQEKKIGVGTHFRVVDYGNVLVRVVGIASVNLFSTWAGGRTVSSWGFRPLDQMKKIEVEQCPQGLDEKGQPWIRKFSAREIVERHTELVLSTTPLFSIAEREKWVSCEEFASSRDMIAVRGKAKANVFSSKNHPYLE